MGIPGRSLRPTTLEAWPGPLATLLVLPFPDRLYVSLT
jgi:hypothetical protein